MGKHQKFQSTVMFALIKPLIMTANKCLSLQHINYGSHLTPYDMYALTDLSIL